MPIYDNFVPSLGNMPTSYASRISKYPVKYSYSFMPYVYICNKIKSDAISSIDLIFKEDDKILDKNHPAVKLFNNPYPGIINTASDLKKLTVINMGLVGECIYPRLDYSGKLRIDILNSYNIQEYMNYNSGLVDYFRFDNSSCKNVYPNKFQPEDLIFLKNANPYNTFRGISPLLLLLLPMDQWMNISIWNNSFFTEGSKNSLVVNTTYEVNNFFTNVAANIKATFNKLFASYVKGQGALMLPVGWSATSLVSNKDLDFISGLNVTIEEIASVYCVPPAYINKYDKANYANIKEQKTIFWSLSNIPDMQAMKECWQISILDKYFPGVTLDWDWSSVPTVNELYNEFLDGKIKQAQAFQLWNATMQFSRDEIAEILEDETLKKKSEVINITVPQSNQDVITSNNILNAKIQLMQLEPEIHIENNYYIIKANKDYLAKVQNKYNDVVLVPYENKWEKVIHNYLNTITDDVKSHLNKYKYSDKLNVKLWQNVWDEMSLPLYKEIFVEGIANAKREIEKPKSILNYNIKQVPDDLEDFLGEEMWDNMEEVIYELSQKTKLPKQLLQDFNEIITDGIKNNLPTDVIRKQLDEQKDMKYASSALTIARTVTGSAYNNARFIGFNMMGVEERMWVACADDHTRYDHTQVNGRTCQKGQLYPIVDLLYPHDPQGDPEQIINCRCTEFATTIKLRNNNLLSLTV